MKNVIKTSFAILIFATLFVACKNSESANSEATKTETKSDEMQVTPINSNDSLASKKEEKTEKTDAIENKESTEKKEANEKEEANEKK